MRKSFWIITIIIGAILFSYFQSQTGEKIKRSTVTAYSSSSMGISLFYRLMNRIKPNSAQLSQKAFYDEKNLQGVETIAILSPHRVISGREAKIVREFVEGGGLLIISFHDEQSLGFLQYLLTELNMTTIVNGRSDFHNGQVTIARPDQDSPLFKKEDTYHFYSNLKFPEEACEKNLFSCFVKMGQLEKGQVILMTGLPIISNALISKGQNAYFAYRLVDGSSTLLIDEYHHFFSDKTLADLLSLPTFILPLAGMFLGVILFFIFGHSVFHEKSLVVEETPAIRSYHQLNERILLGILDRIGDYRLVMTFHTANLSRLFPRAKGELEKIQKGWNNKGSHRRAKKELLRESAQLILLHKKLLAQKGRRDSA